MTVAMLMYNTVQVSKSRLFLLMGKNFNQSLRQHNHSPNNIVERKIRITSWKITKEFAKHKPFKGALRAYEENTGGKWRLSLLPLHPLEKVPSDIEVDS